MTHISPLLDRYVWFKLYLDPSTASVDEGQQEELVREYLGRFDDELETIRAELRPGRPLPKRHDELLMLKKTEHVQYVNGTLTIPDLTDAANVASLRQWGGLQDSLSTVRIIRVKESQAPSSLQMQL